MLTCNQSTSHKLTLKEQTNNHEWEKTNHLEPQAYCRIYNFIFNYQQPSIQGHIYSKIYRIMYSADEENTVVSFYKSLVSSYLTDSGSDSLGRGAIGW